MYSCQAQSVSEMSVPLMNVRGTSPSQRKRGGISERRYYYLIKKEMQNEGSGKKGCDCRYDLQKM